MRMTGAARALLPVATASATLTALTTLTTLTTLTACGSGNPLVPGPRKGEITVASANFPENVLLADIYASELKAKGFKVGTEFNVGSREVLYQQVENGSVTVLPEYNGALLSFVNPTARASTTEQVNEELRRALPASLQILQSSPAEDKNTLVVTGQTAQKNHLAAIGDLRPYAPSMTIGGPPEFKTRQEGLPGLKEKYGLTFRQFQALDTAGPITVKALSEGSVQVATLFTTDPKIETNGFTVLADPKHVFGAQNVTPLAYRAGIDARSAAVLNAVSEKLSTAALAEMMREVLVEKRDIDVVADEWLKAEGLK